MNDKSEIEYFTNAALKKATSILEQLQSIENIANSEIKNEVKRSTDSLKELIQALKKSREG